MGTILGYSITPKSKEDCIVEIINFLEGEKKGNYLVCACPHSLEIAMSDYLFKSAIKNASLIIPDGIGVILASKILGENIRNRVSGYEIFLGLSKVLNDKNNNSSYFFLGSTMETLSKIKNRIKVDFPNIKVAGVYSPPFKSEFSDEENQLIIKTINKAKPDVLWVGMTAPKQEKWIYKHKNQLDVRFIGAIGAVFDFFACNVTLPNPIVDKMKLNWLHRFLQEPQRLWRRNLISTPKFLLRVVHLKLKGNLE